MHQLPTKSSEGVGTGAPSATRPPEGSAFGLPTRHVGDPAAAIISAASECGADVIVVGAHQRSWFGRLFSRSISGAVIRDAEVPVLVAG
jgi:nucleotide-binding universal stress UspA family protein